MKPYLDLYPITINIPIAWGDMDAFQHVNNLVYFRHFESVRIAYFEAIDLLDCMDRTGVGPILAATRCRFKLPLTYPDTVTVGARVASMGADRFMMEYLTISHRFQKPAATGCGEMVTFDYHQNRKTPVPDEIRERLLRLERQAHGESYILPDA